MFRILLFILLGSIPTLSLAKDNMCSAFKNGTFSNTSQDPLLNSTIVKKDGKEQMELAQNGNKTFYQIKWMNDCEYRLFYTKEDAKLDPNKKEINRKGGIIIRVEGVKGDELFYTSQTSKNGGTATIKGTLKKISDDNTM